MNYKYIEDLVLKSKNNDMLSKENLANEFKPLILNISKKTFIDGYDNYDIQNECYKTLFKCVSLYNLDNHRFVAYATNGIKNGINDLIKRAKTRSSAEGYEALILSDNLEHTLPSEMAALDDILCDKCDHESISNAINELSENEKELVEFIFFKNNSVRTYAYWKNICYSTANQRKSSVLKKISKYLN
ncbi:sigma-70 family RNA polymerase sigma factor [Clostridium uliginosum]|uniref:RNA polymerase sigma factor, sigma-70 family n=1 Tax=Clostridium uliginosum TaxID=119641 RepID=A0A1I1R6I9_9CLOT|nr:sigma-70 family RNA polymerase sigma factor [Clostridium uliginosum]SFD29981.1 RNA polymerase sigma factor, sigma-70 family [Clostridium uliginosum]